MKTESKTFRFTRDFVNQVESLANKNNRSFNNMAETLMKIGIKHYKSIEL